MGAELLRPTRIYVRTVRDLLGRMPPGTIRGMAHITGGGLPGNIPRILPPRCHAIVQRGHWNTPPIFDLIARLGRVSRTEMDRTFNNGVGYVLVVAASRRERVLDHLRRRRAGAREIGVVVRGTRGLTFTQARVQR